MALPSAAPISLHYRASVLSEAMGFQAKRFRLASPVVWLKVLILCTATTFGVDTVAQAAVHDDLNTRSQALAGERHHRLAGDWDDNDADIDLSLNRNSSRKVHPNEREAKKLHPPAASTSPNFVLGPGSCNDSSTSCAYQLITNRIAANAANFYVYQDADSGFNHGFASGFTGKISAVSVDPSCIDDPNDQSTGCYPSDDTSHLDQSHGTVLRVSFTDLADNEFAGLNIEEPEDYGQLNYGVGYNLTAANTIILDFRTPTGITATFGVGNCVTLPKSIAPSSAWFTLSVDLNSLYDPNTYLPCTPDLTKVHILFSVTALTNGTILLDNIRFTPVPPPQPNTFSLPTGTQTFGVVPHFGAEIPTDEINRNLASTYEASLSILSVFHGNQQQEALAIADTLDYALFHDNHGVPIPIAPGNGDGCYDGARTSQCGLHNAYINGSIAFYNDQLPGKGGKAGDVRLAGFTGPPNQCSTGFCLVLDGATGGNNAWAMLALLAAYQHSNDMKYLDDATTIGNWIVANLEDTTGTGYGGYYAGYTNGGPKNLERGKSTENNGDIFAAFSLLAHLEGVLGNGSMYTYWSMKATLAGDFVIAMYDSADKRFYAGTVYSSDGPDPCGHDYQKGNDIINTCDYLDSDSFTLLPMAAFADYRRQADWSMVLSYVLQNFTQNASGNNYNFNGLTLENPPMGPGIAWEFTGQTVEACNYLDYILSNQSFQACAQDYDSQMQMAQSSAPFADSLGLVDSTLSNGDQVAPDDQCLLTTYQCIPERVGLAATNWLIIANENFNPMTFADVSFSPSMLDFGPVLVGEKVSKSFQVTSTGTAPLVISKMSVTGFASHDFSFTTDCLPQHLLLGGDTCMVTVTFRPNAPGLRAAKLEFTDNALGAPQAVSLQGVGLDNSHLLTVTKDGTGSGVVTSQDRQIRCGTTCSAKVRGDYALLTELPIQDSVFDGWTGCDYVRGLTCIVIMSQDRSVNATFNKR